MQKSRGTNGNVYKMGLSPWVFVGSESSRHKGIRMILYVCFWTQPFKICPPVFAQKPRRKEQGDKNQLSLVININKKQSEDCPPALFHEACAQKLGDTPVWPCVAARTH